MSQLNVERIKLFSTRSPYWCLGGVVLASAAFAVMFGLIDNGRNAITTTVLAGVSLSQAIFMVLAALAVTTEYRFGTIRTSFLAVPHRGSVLLAKTVLLAIVGGLVGLICAFGAFFLGRTLADSPLIPLELEGETWRVVAGHGVIFAISAVIAVAVGTLIRQSAGAIAILILWVVMIEQLISIIPTVGEKIAPYLPFSAGNRFVAQTVDLPGEFGQAMGEATGSSVLSPVQGLLVFVGYAVVLWIAALVVLRRRDA